MANRTDPFATSIHGTNPQFIVSKIIRQKIHANDYWKEQCFGLTAETIIDKAVELRYIGGTFGGSRKPTPFLCLVLKLLQIQPAKDIIVEYIKQDETKYLRALGVFYLRLVGSPVDIYAYLEPLYIDYRKLNHVTPDGRCKLMRMDEFVDDCLRREDLVDIDLPALPSRVVLEEFGAIDLRVSVLEDDLEFAEDELRDDDDITKPQKTTNGAMQQYTNMIPHSFPRTEQLGNGAQGEEYSRYYSERSVGVRRSLSPRGSRRRSASPSPRPARRHHHPAQDDWAPYAASPPRRTFSPSEIPHPRRRYHPRHEVPTRRERRPYPPPSPEHRMYFTSRGYRRSISPPPRAHRPSSLSPRARRRSFSPRHNRRRSHSMSPRPRQQIQRSISRGPARRSPSFSPSRRNRRRGDRK